MKALNTILPAKGISRYLAIIALFMVTTSCKQCKSFTQKDRRVFIVLIDYSASNSEMVLDNYIHIINETIFLNMGPYDCLTVMPIDKGSKMLPEKLFSKDLADTSFKKPSDGFTHANDSSTKRLRNYITQTMPVVASILKEQKTKRSSYTSETDIVGAIQQTANFIEFNAEQDGMKDVEDFVLGHVRLKSENIIVLLSDMIQDADGFSFNNKKGLTQLQSASFLADLEKQQRIPDLSHCKVFVIGATGKSSAQIDNIAAFWQEYFTRTKGELSAYGYSVEDKLRRYIKQPRE